MMLVGPMKKKMVTTVIIVVVILTAIFGVLGYFLLSGKQKEINELMKKAEVVERYVFTENFPAGHIIDEGDLVLAVVKAESTPANSYTLRTGVTAANREEIYRYTGTNYKAGESLNTLDLLMGRELKINVSQKTTLTDEMLVAIDEAPSDDMRLEEFSMITLPSDLLDGDYIDVRIMFPTGVDYSVLIGKKVESYTDNTIFLKLTEDEILTMGSAIVEAYMYEGTKLYATKYVDPSNQLYDYNKINYVAKYKAAVPALIEAREEKNLETVIAKLRTENAAEFDALVAQYPDTYKEEIAKEHEEEIKVSEKDITIEEIAKYIGLTEYGTSEIKTAIDEKNEEVLNRYENKIVASKKSLSFTYPVNGKVAAAIKNNPNILADVKNNFDIDALIAKEVEKYFDELYITADEELERIEEQYEKVIEQVKTDIKTQKDERVRFLNSLATEE
ncbi:MAG: hypothetical protein J6B87_00340 [Clostridia bacterium]|nr:hypothetical protein [Clostridia bacterium]